MARGEFFHRNPPRRPVRYGIDASEPDNAAGEQPQRLLRAIIARLDTDQDHRALLEGVVSLAQTGGTEAPPVPSTKRLVTQSTLYADAQNPCDDPPGRLAFVERLSHQPKHEMPEVAQTAVEQRAADPG